MLALVLVSCGLVATVAGCWYGYAAARSALVPLIREGDPTRTLIEATRPVYERSRFRTAVRNVLVAVGWIAVAMYGMYLATVGLEVMG